MCFVRVCILYNVHKFVHRTEYHVKMCKFSQLPMNLCDKMLVPQRSIVENFQAELP